MRSLHICAFCLVFYRSVTRFQVEFKTLQAVSFSSDLGSHFPDWKRERDLCEHVRQMAISQTILRDSSAGSFIVLIGRDHRVLVLEDTGVRDATGLPLAFAWLKNCLDYWFRPTQPFAAFLKAFAAAVGPYSRRSAERKQQWDSDCDSDFSGWNFLFAMLGPVVARLNEAKERCLAEFERRKHP
jgi:hypothetical protein